MNKNTEFTTEKDPTNFATTLAEAIRNLQRGILPILSIVTFLCTGVVALTGCGGSGNAIRENAGRVAVSVTWPARPTTASRLIPAASNVIQIELDSGKNIIAGPVTLRRPSDFGVSTSTTFSAVPAGALTVRATAYPSADSANNPQGTPQSAASALIVVTDGQTTSASLTMNSTVAKVTVAPPGVVALLGTASATATAKDSMGNVVLVASGAWSWASLNPGIASVTTNSDGTATVKGAGAGTTTISATYMEPTPHVVGTATVTVTGGGGSGFQPGSPWPMNHHDLQHTGIGSGSGAVGTKAWEFNAGNASSPAIAADGTIYINSGESTYAINPSGSQKWMYSSGQQSNDYVSSPAIGADGTIYAGFLNGLYAINSSGTKKWAFNTGTGGIGISSSPAIGPDGTIYVGSNMGFFAVNQDGTERWAFKANLSFSSSPAIAADGTIYVLGNDGNVYAISPSGSQEWAFRALSDTYSSPAIGTDGTIYIGSGTRVYAINSNGTQKWVFQTSGQVYSSPAIGLDGTIYIGSSDYNLYAIKPDGTQKWAFATGLYITSSPVIGADGTIYIGSKDSNFYAINPDGSHKWMFVTGAPIGFASPAIGADGTIYIGSDQLYAIH